MSSVYSDFAEEDGPASRLLAIFRRVGMGLVAMVVLVAAALLFLEIENQLDRSRVAQSDNTTWVMAQFEVDLLNLAQALSAFDDVPADGDRAAALREVRKRFDILYSRVDIMDSSEQVGELPIRNSSFWEEVVGPGGFIPRVTAIVDSTDERLAASIPDIAREIDTLREPARRLIVKSLTRRIEIGDSWRTDLRSALQFFAAASIGLLSILSVMMVTIYVQSRAEQRRGLMLESAVQNLRTTVNASVNPVILVDFDGRIQGWNKAGTDLFGLSAEDQGLRHFGTIIRSGDGRFSLEQITQSLIRGAFRTDFGDRKLMMIGTTADGRDIPCEMHLAESRGPDGQSQFIAFVRDMSVQLERERILTDARNAALRGEEAKARFLGVMSHEMRTPLNGLLSATDLLMRTTNLDERQAWLTGIIHSCGRATLDQVNNVLELTRLGASDSPGYQSAPFSPVETIRELILHSQPDAIVRGNNLRLAEPVPVLPMLSGARQLFHRIINNLLSNAIKFTENGDITVSIDVEPGADAGSYALRVSVKDNGIGIAEQDLDRIFHNFETLDSSYARMQQGSGLGLGIAKLSAEALGGRITVESRLDQGSTFSLFVTLPKADVAEEAQSSSPTRRVEQGRSVLVVEDNALNRHLLVELLSHQGYHVASAEDGVEAVEIASQERFDVILMDVSMPRMDGLEATRRIRAGGASSDVPILAVTANADPDKLNDFLATGMNDVLTKPVEIESLEATIRRYMAPGRPSAGMMSDMVAAAAEAMPPRSNVTPLSSRIETAAAQMPAPTAPLRRIGAEGAAVADVPPTAAPLRATVDSVPLLDEATMADLEEQLGREFIAKMTLRFVSEADAAMGELADTEAAGDLPKAAQVAHKAAGAAAALGLKGLHRVLVTFENEAKAGEAEAARARIARIEQIKRDTYALLRERGLIA